MKGRELKWKLELEQQILTSEKKQDRTPGSTHKLSDSWSLSLGPVNSSGSPKRVSGFSLGATGPGLAWEGSYKWRDLAYPGKTLSKVSVGWQGTLLGRGRVEKGDPTPAADSLSVGTST